MKCIKPHKILFAFLLLSVVQVFSQPILSIEYAGFQPPDTLFAGANFSHQLRVKNVSSFDLNSVNLTIYLAADQNGVQITPTSPGNNIDSVVYSGISISANADTVLTFSVPAGTANSAMKAGDNIIVIWPRPDDSHILQDYIQDDIEVVYHVGIADEKYQPRLAIFPNPFSDVLNIQAYDYVIEGVKIYTIDGKLVKDQRIVSLSIIETHDLPTGVYLLEIEGEDKRLFHRQIIK